MHAIALAYRRLLAAFAVVAAAMLAAIFVSVVVDVTVRQLGAQPPAWAVPLSEYLLLYATLLGSPWVLRSKGHVLVDSFVGMLPRRAAAALARAVYVGCAAACAAVTVIAADITLREFAAESTDVRAVLVPKFLLTAPFVPAFGLMAIEFLRFAAGFDSLYIRPAAPSE